MAASFRFRMPGSEISAIGLQRIGRILELARIANVFDPHRRHGAVYSGSLARRKRIERRSAPGEKDMWEISSARLNLLAALLGVLFAAVLAPDAQSEEPKLSI